ncbi:SGNH/GDSL hydrolase family protein [bacterium]|nr:SGNH/GDSL hydrolase family protein [bacterium]
MTTRPRRVGFAAIAVAFVLAAAEIALRVAGYAAPVSALDYRLRVIGEIVGEPDADLFWSVPKPPPDFPAEVLGIVALADSVAVMDGGAGYPEDLPALIEARGVVDREVRVYNAGVPNYTVFQGRKFYERDLAGHGADIVTIHFGVNDHWRAVGSRPDSQIRMPPATLLATHRALLTFRLYQAIRAGIFRPYDKAARDRPFRVPPDEYARELARLVAIVRADGARPILVVSPYLAGGADWEPDHRRYQQITREVGKAERVPVVDVADGFLHAPGLFLFPDDDPIHITREGGRVIAEAIADAVMANAESGIGIAE